VSGALLEEEYREKLTKAGFENITVQVTREYDLSDPFLRGMLKELSDAEIKEFQGSVVSAFIRALKPEK
jgi:hypothetical protein